MECINEIAGIKVWQKDFIFGEWHNGHQAMGVT